MRNPFLQVFLHFKVPKQPYLRWPPYAILENLNCHSMLYNVILEVFWYEGSNSACKFALWGPRITISKMAHCT